MKNLRMRIMERMGQLTTGERKIANVIFADYPFGALGTLQDLAQKAGVSVPSVIRFVAKFGFDGFKDFQRELMEELQEGQRSPRDLAGRMSLVTSGAAQESFFADYIAQLGMVLNDMVATVPSWQFDQFAALLKDPSRHIFLIGGRISDNIATFLGVNLRQMRSGVFHISSNPELWPEYVLRMRRQDVVLFFDFRRYQQSLIEFAATIHASAQPHILLVTDKWMSPIARCAKLVVALPTEAGRAWDTMMSAAAFAEALIVKIMEQDWEAAQKRIQKWDAIRGVDSLMDKR